MRAKEKSAKNAQGDKKGTPQDDKREMFRDEESGVPQCNKGK